MEIIFALLSGLYALFVGMLCIGWRKFSETDLPLPGCFCRVSVIIAVRNEQANIGSLLADLEQQSFPCELFEVIIVNDHSTDDTAGIVAEFSRNSLINIRLLQLAEGESTKKTAIARGVHQATGELILATDGDCRVGTDWIATVHDFYQWKKPMFISAPVTFGFQQSWFERLQTVEFASLIGTGAACMQLGIPNMCNGANLAYPREVFFEVGGFAGTAHIASGDDEFLMQKIRKKYPQAVLFLKNKKALVTTRAQQNLSLFFHQRKRWAGKWKLHKDWKIALVAVFIFLYHLFFVLFLLLWLAGASFNREVVLTCFGIRIAGEFLFLSQVLHFSGQLRYAALIPVVQVFYSFYAVFMGIVANFGGYRWKDRKLN